MAGGHMIAQFFAKMQLDMKNYNRDMNKAQKGFDGLKKSAIGVKTVLASVVTAWGGKKFASSLINVAKEAQNLQTQLDVVIKDADKAKEAFNWAREFGRITPFLTNDVVQAYAYLEMMGIKSAKNAIRIIGDTASVYKRSISDVAQAFFGLETEVFRKMGVIINRTGKIWSVEVDGRIYETMENTIPALRDAVLKSMDESFGGGMKKAEDNWDGAMATMQSMWEDMLLSIMGTGKDGGPFDIMLSNILEIRDTWSEWSQSTEGVEFIEDWQRRFTAAIEVGISAVTKLVDALGWFIDYGPEIITTVAAWKVGMKAFAAQTALAGTAIGTLSTAFAPFLVGGAILVGITAAGVAIQEMIDKVVDPQNDMEDAFDDLILSLTNVQDEAKRAAAEVGAVYLMGHGLPQAGEAFYATPERVTKAQSDYEGMPRIYGDEDKAIKKPEVAEPAEAVKEAAKSAKKEMTALEKLQKELNALQWEYNQGLEAAEVYYDTLNGKLDDAKVGTEEWKVIFGDTQSIARDIAGDSIDQMIQDLEDGKIGIEAFNAQMDTLKAKFEGLPLVMEEVETGMAEGMEAAARITTEKWNETWDNLGWRYQHGFIDAEMYYDMIQERLAAATEGTNEWRAAYEELETAALDIVNIQLDSLWQQFIDGKLTAEELRKELERINAEYDKFPQVEQKIKKVDKKLKDTTDTSQLLAKYGEEWTKDLAEGMAAAIVEGRSLEDVLANLGRELAKYVIQQMIIGPLLGAIGLPGMADGGIVTSPTVAMIGEAGPEAVIPMPHGEIPVSFTEKMSSAGSEAKPAEITMINLLDKSQLDEIATENLAKNKEIVINHFFRDMDERGMTLTALRRG